MKSTALQFSRFSITGFVAFCVTTAVVYATRPYLGTTLAGIPAFLSAMTTGWVLNTFWTFRHKSQETLFVQWSRYAVFALPTLLINLLAYEILVVESAFIRANPFIATAAAAVAGLFFSFAVMRQFVFKTSGKGVILQERSGGDDAAGTPDFRPKTRPGAQSGL